MGRKLEFLTYVKYNKIFYIIFAVFLMKVLIFSLIYFLYGKPTTTCRQAEETNTSYLAKMHMGGEASVDEGENDAPEKGVDTNASGEYHHIISNLEQEFQKEQQRRECCRKKQRCCGPKDNNYEDDQPAISLKTILIKCTTKFNTEENEGNVPCDGNKKHHSKKEKHHKKHKNGKHYTEDTKIISEEESVSQTELRNCRKKLKIWMKVESHGQTTKQNNFICVDHVYDPSTGNRAKLLNKYMIKIKQETVLQMYPLKFLHVVNANAREEVINKQSVSRYKGCDVETDKPTCGAIRYNDNIIPYSKGFCCSCDAMTNAQYQHGLRESPESVEGYIRNAAPTLEGVLCPKFLTGYKENENKHKRKTFDNDDNIALNNLYLNSYKNDLTNGDGDLLLKEMERDYSGEDLIRSKRQLAPGGVQIRGGQNCLERSTPSYADPIRYHESTHCLRFSDLWYTVYELHQPIIKHSALLQIFERQENLDGSMAWIDLNHGEMIRIGTMEPHYTNKAGTISIRYAYPKNVENSPNPVLLNYSVVRLLVPQAVPKGEEKKHPEIQQGAPEYLILHEKQITMEGEKCDVAGVGFEAFVKQPRRCARTKGSCLAHQPSELWRHDKEQEALEKRGCFFLKHYGNVSKAPIMKRGGNGSDEQQYIGLRHPGSSQYTVAIEIKADVNAMVRKESRAKITEVYVEATNPAKTDITVKVTNTGLTASTFKVRIADCPLEMPAAWTLLETKSVLIPPQHQHVFSVQIKSQLTMLRLYCSAEVLNSNSKEIIALRRIRIQKFDRCICAWHCLCACVESSDGMKCKPMTIEHYRAAGFYGSLPVLTKTANSGIFDSTRQITFYVLIFINVLLLILGLTKAILGLCCCPKIGFWGLDVLLDLPKNIPHYIEPHLQGRRVVYDRFGWPIDPDTKHRVKTISNTTEFCLNVIFFFTYPISVILLIVKKLCCPYYAIEDYTEEDIDQEEATEMCLFDTNKTKTRTIYGSTSNSIQTSSNSANSKDNVQIVHRLQVSCNDRCKCNTSDEEDDDEDESDSHGS